MDLSVVGSLREVDRSEFARLGVRGGVRASYDRLLQRESDKRVGARYLCVRDAEELVGVLPLYAPAAARLLDPAYDPSQWDATAGTVGQDPAVLLVGGSADLRSSLHIAESHRRPDHMRVALDHVQHIAGDLGRSRLVLPYLDEADRDLIEAANPGMVRWFALGREAIFDRITDGPGSGWHRSSKVGYVLRRDQRLIDDAGTGSCTAVWSDVEAEASRLISDNNVRHGQRDHAEFVKMRHREWDECENAELVVFAARAGSVRGYLSAVAWQDELDLYEVGLSAHEGPAPARTPVYLSLLIHQPRAFAELHGLRRIRAGLGSETPKSSRGARMVAVYGGVAAVGSRG